MDQLYYGQRLRCLTIVCAFSKLSPAIGIGFHDKAADVVETLERAAKEYGYTCFG